MKKFLILSLWILPFLFTELNAQTVVLKDEFSESKEKLEAEAKQLNASVQEQLRQFKQDLLLRLETIKGQLSNSQKDLTEL
ncbi:MAG: hypothetical protein ACK419_05710, partial [Pyrinomonadaceae bacterium]